MKPHMQHFRTRVMKLSMASVSNTPMKPAEKAKKNAEEKEAWWKAKAKGCTEPKPKLEVKMKMNKKGEAGGEQAADCAWSEGGQDDGPPPLHICRNLQPPHRLEGCAGRGSGALSPAGAQPVLLRGGCSEVHSCPCQ